MVRVRIRSDWEDGASRYSFSTVDSAPECEVSGYGAIAATLNRVRALLSSASGRSTGEIGRLALSVICGAADESYGQIEIFREYGGARETPDAVKMFSFWLPPIRFAVVSVFSHHLQYDPIDTKEIPFFFDVAGKENADTHKPSLVMR